MMFDTEGKKWKLLNIIFTTTNHCWEYLFFMHTLSLNKEVDITKGSLLKELARWGYTKYTKHKMRNALEILKEAEIVTTEKINRVGNSIIFDNKYVFTPFGKEVARCVYEITKNVYVKVDKEKNIKEESVQ